MSDIQTKSLLLRIQNEQNKLDDLINFVIKSQNVSSSVFDALDKRILQTVTENYVSWSTVIPYLRKEFRNVLFKSMDEKHHASGFELAELYKLGYGGDELERRLCKDLYDVYLGKGVQLYGHILDAMSKRGGTESLEMLQIIKFELDPILKTKQIVVDSIETQINEGESLSAENTLNLIECRWLRDFTDAINAAIKSITPHCVESTKATEPNITEVIQTNTKDSDEADTDKSPNHQRKLKIQRYLLKAKELLPDHPPESLNNSRKAAEAICKDLIEESYQCDTSGKLKPSKGFNSLEDMLKEVIRRRLTPSHIDKYLGSIQSFGNFASHDQDDDPESITREMAQSILSHLEAVITWHNSLELTDGTKHGK